MRTLKDLALKATRPKLPYVAPPVFVKLPTGKNKKQPIQIDKISFDNISRAIGYSICASLLLQTAGEILKQDTEFYRYNLKKKVDAFLDESRFIWGHIDKLKNLFIDKKRKEEMAYTMSVNEDSVDGLLDDELSDEQAVFSMFMKAYFSNNNPVDIQKLYFALNNIVEKKPLYTREEVIDLLTIQLKKLTTMTPAPSYFETILNELPK